MSVLKRLWSHLRRGPFQSLAAILVTLFVFLTSTLFFFLMVVFYSAINFFESRPEVTAFIKDEASKEEINKMIKSLEDVPGVKNVRYVSKQDALRIYQDLNKDNPLLLEMVTAEILPASIEISAEDPESLHKVASRLEQKKDLFEDIVFPQEMVNFLIKFVDSVKIIGLVILGFLLILALIVITVVVGMKITLFKSEIEVLRLLGGGGSYIRMPFLLEGATYGFLGPFLGGGLILGLILFFKNNLLAFLSHIFIPAPDFNLFFLIVGAQIAFGILIGLLAAFLAVRKHLK